MTLGCDSPVVTFFPLWENKDPHTVFPHRHLETSLSCPRFLVHKKNECIVAFTSHGNNFWNRLTVKSNGFALFIHWNGASVPSFLCSFLCFYNINTRTMYNVCKSIWLTWSCIPMLMADYSQLISSCGSKMYLSLSDSETRTLDVFYGNNVVSFYRCNV